MAWDTTRTRVGEGARWETIPCPVCDSTAFEHLFEKGGEPFVKCASCTLIMINPRPVLSHIGDTYNPAYTQGYINKKEKKLRRTRRWVKRIRNSGASSGRWLDIGCSAGFVVVCARQAGYDAYGIDIEPSAIAYARSQLELEHVFTGVLEEQSFPDGYFNVISAYELIEHVPDLNRFTCEMARLLAPHGIIEIRTPDAGHWRTPRRLEQWDAILPSEHLYYFTRETLSRLLEKHGLRIARQRLSLKPGLKVYATHCR